MKFSILVLVVFFALFCSVNAKTPICSVKEPVPAALIAFSKQLPALCEKNYPKIVEILSAQGFKAPAKVKLVFNALDEGVPAQALGDTIELNICYFKKNPNDLGAVVHELVHVVQSYPVLAEGMKWMQEGIADYVRYQLGYPSKYGRYAYCDPEDRYTDGYWCGAAFLQFIEREYKQKQLINVLNVKLRQKSYNDVFLKELTGKTLEQLWEECLATDCKGGKP